MFSSSGRYVIVFNGEIYNHLDLRTKLENRGTDGALTESWRGHSDTETLLAGFDAWGIKATVEKCIGMFACLLYTSPSPRDRQKSRMPSSA